MAARLSEPENREVYAHMRKLEQRVRATEQALSLGFDSARLNPWARRARDLLVRQMRRIAYIINESAPSWSEMVQKQEWALGYAQLIEEIGSILASTVGYIRSPTMTQSSDVLNFQIAPLTFS